MKIRVGILTCSDSAARGKRDDLSGRAIKQFCLETFKTQPSRYAVVPDEKKRIARTLKVWADRERLDIIFTTGGTGFSPRDVTPEAALSVIEREAPGISEAMRAFSIKKTPHAMISRGVSGIRKRTLIVNLPGSPSGVRDGLLGLKPVLSHAIELLRGLPPHHGQKSH